jgi:hypothetical protein
MKQIILSSFFMALASGASIAQTCNCTTISGTLSTRTLDNDHCWELDGCVTVPDNVTLTIEEGTMIYPQPGSALIVEKGGVINVNGTSSDPVIFIPKLIANRTYGYWEGVSIAGRGINNESSGDLTLNGSCPVTSGGNSNSDNSGSVTYMQLHFAAYGFQLGSVGTGTTIDNVQVTYSNNDGFTFRGGAVKATHLASFNAKGNDFFISNGYVGKMQYLFAFREDAGANLSGGSSGMVVTNDATGSSSTPLTRPIVSNYTTLGPLFCNGSASTNFNYGLQVSKNAQAGVYNSVIANWKDEGFRIDDVSTVGNTDLDLLNYSYNSTEQNGSDYGTSASWASGCTNSSMTDWLTFDPLTSCTEDGNQYAASISTLGYDNTSICGGSANPDFSLDLVTTDLDAASFSPSDLSSGFTTVSYRGAFGSTDWTDAWTDWAPLTTAYCESELRSGSNDHGLMLSPNPANRMVTASFNLSNSSDVQLDVIDPINGKIYLSVPSQKMELGKQTISLDISSLRLGSYIIQVRTSEGTLQQHLMVQ